MDRPRRPCSRANLDGWRVGKARDVGPSRPQTVETTISTGDDINQRRDSDYLTTPE